MNASEHSNESTPLKAERYLPDVVAKPAQEARQAPAVYMHCPPPQLQSYLLHLAALSGSQPIRDVIEHQNRAIDYSIGGDNAGSWSITEQQRRRVTSSSPPSGNSITSASPAGSSIHHHNLISALPAVSFLPSLLGDFFSKSSSAIFPYPVARAAAAAAAALHHASASATHHRHHYQPASVDHLKRCFSGSDGSSSTLLPTATADSFHRQLQAVAAAAAAAQRAAAAAVTAHHNDEPKPTQSYIGLIAMAILNSTDRKLVLSDIYQWILDHYPYFRHRGPGWRNSIRHNLSLNDCFVKAGRSANGKGHYWAVHPANVEDFERGDFRRRRAQRKVRRAMGLAVLPDDNDDDLDSPMPSPAAIDYFRSPPTLLRCSSGPTAITASVSRFTTDSDRTTLAMWENDVTSPAVTDVHYSNIGKQGDATLYSGTWGAAHFDKRRYPLVSAGDDVSSLNRLQTTNMATTTKTVTSFRRRLFDIESILASNNEEVELTSCRTDDCQHDSPSSTRADATLRLDHVVQNHDKDNLSTAPITGSEDGHIESEDGGDALSTITCSSCNWCSAHINNHCSGRGAKDTD